MPTYVAPKVFAGEPHAFDRAPKAPIACCPWAAYPTAPKACGAVCYTDEALLVRLTCFEQSPKITYYQPNEPVYKDSCLEFFINPLPGQNTFCDFECNAAGTLLLGHFHEGSFGLLDPAARPDFQVKAVRESDFWQVDLTLPASFLEQTFPGFRFADGGEMAVNFYKCGDETDHPHYSCWSPIEDEKPNFFHAENFGILLRR